MCCIVRVGYGTHGLREITDKEKEFEPAATQTTAMTIATAIVKEYVQLPHVIHLILMWFAFRALLYDCLAVIMKLYYRRQRCKLGSDAVGSMAIKKGEELRMGMGMGMGMG